MRTFLEAIIALCAVLQLMMSVPDELPKAQKLPDLPTLEDVKNDN